MFRWLRHRHAQRVCGMSHWVPFPGWLRLTLTTGGELSAVASSCTILAKNPAICVSTTQHFDSADWLDYHRQVMDGRAQRVGSEGTSTWFRSMFQCWTRLWWSQRLALYQTKDWLQCHGQLPPCREQGAGVCFYKISSIRAESQRKICA